MQDNVRIAVAEGFGTMVLIVGGPGTAILAGANVGQLGVALAFGLSLMVMVFAIGHISGCHINPSVTVAALVARRIEGAKVPYYVGGQVVGGLLGGLVVFVIASGLHGFNATTNGFASNGYGAHSPAGYGLGAVAMVEIVTTALFVLVILAATRKGAPNHLAGVVIGLMLTLVHLISIQVSNASVNPARSLATAVFQHTWALEQLWAFIVFPLIGAVVGAGVWLLLDPAELAAWEAAGAGTGDGENETGA